MPPTGPSSCGDTGVGTRPDDDVLVVEEPDERFHLGVGRTKDGRYVIVEMHSRVTSEVHVIPADRARGDAPRRRAAYPGRRVRHRAPRRHLHRADQRRGRELQGRRHPGRRPVAPVVARAHPPSRRRAARGDSTSSPGTSSATSAEKECPGSGSSRSPTTDPVWDRELPEGYLVPCPETPSASWGGPNPEFTSRSLRYEYSSLVTPRSVYDLDLDGGDAVLRKRQTVLGGYDPSRYVTERQWAIAPDGTRVPMSIVARRDVARDGTAPCLLYGYGSYEYSIDPVFSSLRLSLLDRGFVFVIAHVRGGGELGRRWYEDGKLLAKPNTFSDFVACARQLVEDRWTAPDRLVARGGSAGGLLMGADRQPGSRAVPGHGGRGALRRLPEHDARRHPPPDRHRVGGVGEPRRRSRGVPR